MKFFDLLRLIAENLNRRKGRVALTAVGVVIGTAAVVVLVSLAIGLQQNFAKNLYGISDLTRIDVYPGFPMEAQMGGPMTPEQMKLLTTRMRSIPSLPSRVW